MNFFIVAAGLIIFIILIIFYIKISLKFYNLYIFHVVRKVSFMRELMIERYKNNKNDYKNNNKSAALIDKLYSLAADFSSMIHVFLNDRGENLSILMKREVSEIAAAIEKNNEENRLKLLQTMIEIDNFLRGNGKIYDENIEKTKKYWRILMDEINILSKNDDGNTEITGIIEADNVLYAAISAADEHIFLLILRAPLGPFIIYMKKE